MFDNRADGTGGLDTNGGNLGGGQVLDYIGQNEQEPEYLDSRLIGLFEAIPWVKVVILILLVFAAVLIVMAIFKVRSPFRGRTITKELDHLNKVKKHDEQVIRANRLIKGFTAVIEHSPFKMQEMNKDYWAYNLRRANIRIPGKSRVMKPEEFNAIVSGVEAVVMAAGALIAITLNPLLGCIIIVSAMTCASTLPMMIIRQTVKAKDQEIVENFADFYLMIHYVLLASASTPLEGIMKSYDKTTNSEEMHRFVDSCVHYIDTYGEYAATSHIAKEFREIAEVSKLMRLIRQSSEGGDVRMELEGFRNELLSAKKYAIEQRMNKMVAKAKASFALLYVVLVQAIISAMAIYMQDIGGIGSMFGGLS